VRIWLSQPYAAPSAAGARTAAVKTMFWTFLLLTVGGIVLYSIIGLTHN
jgi:hypothetical protein